MTNIKKLKKFIKDNNLVFKSGYRNTPSVVLTGYAQHIGASMIECINAVNTTDSKTNNEIERIYEFAERNNYKEYWNSEEVKKLYKF